MSRSSTRTTRSRSGSRSSTSSSAARTRRRSGLKYSEIAKNGVEFRQERVTAIDPAARRVTTDRSSYDAEILVVALGATYDHAATPGFEDGGYEYYTIGGAERLRDALPAFE